MSTNNNQAASTTETVREPKVHDLRPSGQASASGIQLPDSWNKMSMAEQSKYITEYAKSFARTAKAAGQDFDAANIPLEVGKVGGITYKNARRDVFPITLAKTFDPRLEARMIRFALDNRATVSPSYSKDGIVRADVNSPVWATLEARAKVILPALDIAAAYLEGDFDKVLEMVAEAQGQQT